LCGPTKKIVCLQHTKKKRRRTRTRRIEMLAKKKRKKNNRKKTVQSIIQKDHEGRKGSMGKKGRELGCEDCHFMMRFFFS
jgi:hypothetical protein